jgi:hypothetical protein
VKIRTMSPFVRALAAILYASFIAACGASESELPEDDVEETTEAYSGTIATLVDTPTPRGAPTSWAQPDSEGILGQNGYCGATAASNLLGWYNLRVSPREAIDGGCWSYIGTTASRLATYLRTTHPQLGCARGTLGFDDDALGALRGAIGSGHPVIVQFMTGSLNAHWVTVVGIRGAGSNPQLVVMTWGKFMTVRWADFQDSWRRAWGGYYPHVMCSAVSPRATALVER